ncbi:uridine kinase [Xylanibacter ruminicola]|uniref:Uridine kinase n=1 Tax=Xylanibacter ruminicola TaxID=839 RepID=A0A1H5SVR5_XYLRU|nr:MULTISPECIES: nucleoside kinase [Prevotellaceae]SEF53887.1 uridine kinase [Xylanibacter ruminicola]SEV94228.1 uridine kinase [Prevotella sp. khp7]
MEQTIKIHIRNNEKTIEAPMGASLEDVYQLSGIQLKHGPISACVNNKVEGMHFRVYKQKEVEFLDITSPSGSRAYTRSLFFVLCKAVHDLYSPCKVAIDIPVSNGYYVNLNIGRPVTLDDAGTIRRRMQEIIDAALPIHRHETTTKEAITMFDNLHNRSKVKLLESTGSLYTTYYDIDGYKDYYYGSLLTNTSQLYLFGLEKYYDGLLLRIPSMQHPDELGEMTHQDKMFGIFKEHHQWQDILGLRTLGDLNEVITKGYSPQLIQISEALQEKKIAGIADEIAQRKGIKMVLIAGPSSSGKTTTCKRLSVQLAVNGIKPVPISLDDYFIDRDQTPRDEKGDYDFEHLHALNLPLLNEQLTALFRGDEVELPRYDFSTGTSQKSGRKLRLGPNEILVVEGIHALNPELTSQIPSNQIFRVYASALTTVLLDNHNYIPTTDNRLLRRIIRDYKYRAVSAQETIRRWPSVRAGENKWIFPYQENADAMFNTAMLFELAVIKSQAEPLLEQVPENCKEHAEAYRLLKFLRYIKPIPETQIPPTSLLREFLGGSSFKY